MTYTICILAICLTLLLAQHRSQQHARVMQAEERLLHKIETRVSALERMKQESYSHAAFEDLKSKVEALRLAQGLKR